MLLGTTEHRGSCFLPDYNIIIHLKDRIGILLSARRKIIFIRKFRCQIESGSRFNDMIYLYVRSSDEKRLCLTMVVLFVFFVSEKNPNTKLQNSIDSRRLWPLLVLQNSMRSCVCWSGWFSRYILVDIHTSCLSIMIIVLVVLDPIFCGRVVNLRNSLPDSVNYSSLPKIKCTVK